jgi:hypothetical protein
MKMYAHRGPYIQRGRGFGSFFSSIFRTAVPALKTFGSRLLNSSVTKNVGKTLAKSALKGGLSLAADTVAGKDIGESFSSNVNTARQALAKTLRKEANGGKSVPVKRKRVPSKKPPVLKYPRRAQPRKSLFEEDVEAGSDSE